MNKQKIILVTILLFFAHSPVYGAQEAPNKDQESVVQKFLVNPVVKPLADFFIRGAGVAGSALVGGIGSMLAMKLYLEKNKTKKSVENLTLEDLKKTLLAEIEKFKNPGSKKNMLMIVSGLFGSATCGAIAWKILFPNTIEEKVAQLDGKVEKVNENINNVKKEMLEKFEEAEKTLKEEVKTLGDSLKKHTDDSREKLKKDLQEQLEQVEKTIKEIKDGNADAQEKWEIFNKQYTENQKNFETTINAINTEIKNLKKDLDLNKNEINTNIDNLKIDFKNELDTLTKNITETVKQQLENNQKKTSEDLKEIRKTQYNYFDNKFNKVFSLLGGDRENQNPNLTLPNFDNAKKKAFLSITYPTN